MTRAPWILAVVLLAAVLRVSPSAIAQSKTVCDEDLYLPKKISCYVEAARARNDPSVCLTAEDPVRFQCISLYAERAEDESACRLLVGSDHRAQIGRDACVAGVAVASIEPALCEQVESTALADSC
jgi:hypothetical protein